MKITRFAIALALVAPSTTYLLACSGDDSSTSSTDDGGTGDGASQSDAGGGDDGGTSGDTGTDAPAACNTLGLLGSAVDVYLEQGTPPTAVGGSLPDGTYVLTDARLYGPAVADAGDGGPQKIPNASTQTTIQVSGGTVQIVTKNSQGTTSTETDTFTASGSTLTLNETCPKAQSNSTQYSVVNGDGGVVQLVLYVSQKGVTGVETLDKQ